MNQVGERMTTLGAVDTHVMQADKQLIDFIHRYYSDDKAQARLAKDKIESILVQFNAIKKYAQDTFPNQTILSDEEMIILTLSIFAAHQSPEKAILDKENRSYMELKRALSRFYCLQLLQKGGAGFEAFIASQPRDKKFSPSLKDSEYLALSEKFSKLETLTVDTLKVATLISSVPLSVEARKRADLIFGKDKYLVDSVEFPAKVFEDINVACKVYPQVEILLNSLNTEEERSRAIKLLKSAFSHHRHFRHMLYTEGSKNMFASLLKEVKEKRLDMEAFEFWNLFWTINITGFQGQVDPRGSYYLTSNTFRAMRDLESVLSAVFDDESISEKELLSGYLNYRAHMLDLGNTQALQINLNVIEQQFLAHIGAMMRLYQPEQGQILGAVYKLQRNVLNSLRKDFFSADETMPTPTYAPALFANAKDRLIERYEEEKVFLSTKRINVKYLSLTAQDLKEMLATFEAIYLCMPLYLKAVQEYKRLRSEGRIALDIPLSFQTIANQKWIEELFDKSVILDKVNILELVDITVNDKGAVGFVKRPNYDELLGKQQEAESVDLSQPKPLLMSGFSTAQSLAPTITLGQTPSASIENKKRLVL